MLSSELTRLLGTRTLIEPLSSAARAAQLDSAFVQAHAETEDLEWARVAHWWEADETDTLVETLHRMSALLGTRLVWLIVGGTEPQVASLVSDKVLDNPLGFGGLAGDDLRLLDQEVPAGIWLTRHTYHGATQTQFRWEFEAWGAEPWLSAATRALRGEG